MIPRALALLFLGTSSLPAEDRDDLLRFTNGDQLHGEFLGIKEGPRMIWKRGDVEAPVDFKTSGIRHLVLHGGRPGRALESLSHIGLVNGDRVPGGMTGLDAEFLTVDTGCAGILRVPRKQVALLAPNPMGGRMCFYGPFSEDGWSCIHPSFPEGLPEPAPDAKPDEDAPQRWSFSGSAWYWKAKGAGTALVRKEGMPDRAVLSFQIAWKNRLSLAVAFHSDFLHPKPKDAEDAKEGRDDRARAFVPGDTSDLPRLFGNSYVLQMYSSYLMLYRTTVDADGKTAIQRVHLNSNNIRLGESGTATVEIRSNRRTGGISLFVNDEFVTQWNEGEQVNHDDNAVGFAGKGSGFGFVVQSDDSPVRVSDVVVYEWNGMPDSARSLETDDQDVVLMANGTDRYAGRVRELDADRKLVFEGRHGQFRFPLDEVAEIRFAHQQLATASEPQADSMVVRLSPIGRISGKPVAGDAGALTLNHPALGGIRLSMDSAVMLEFNASNQIVDDWDADF